MQIEISVPEVGSVFKAIQQQPETIFDKILLDVRKMVGRYLAEAISTEFTQFLGRVPYERKEQDLNYRKGSYGLKFTIMLVEVEFLHFHHGDTARPKAATKYSPQRAQRAQRKQRLTKKSRQENKIFRVSSTECTVVDFIGFSLCPLCLSGETKRKFLG